MKTVAGINAFVLSQLYVALYNAASVKESENSVTMKQFFSANMVEVVMGDVACNSVKASFKLITDDDHQAESIQIVVHHRANSDKIIYSSRDRIKDYNYANHMKFVIDLMDNEYNHLKECNTYG
jgi:hypothetical protein